MLDYPSVPTTFAGEPKPNTLRIIAGLTRNLLVKCILAWDAENAELDSVSA